MSSDADSEDADVTGQALVARELRRHRERAGLNLSQLAKRIGYSRTYISTSEKPGADLVSEEVVRRIDEELDARGGLIALRAQAHTERLARRTAGDVAVPETGSASAQFDGLAVLGGAELAARLGVVDLSGSSRKPEGGSVGILPVRGDSSGATASAAGQHTEREMAEQVSRAEFLKIAAATIVGAATTPPGVADLLADPPSGEGGGSWASGVYDAVLNATEHAGRWLATVSACPEPIRPVIENAMAASLTGRYHALDVTLPRLIGRAEAQALATPGKEGAQRDLADVYSVAGWVLIKADLPLGAWIAAQRAVRAAERANDSVRTAAAMRCLAEVHMRNGNHEKASHTALLATVTLDTPATGAAEAGLAISVRGAALLSAAAASARRGERGEARVSLAGASRCADRLGSDRFDLATVFGPTNVAIHRVAVAVELGDFAEAVGLADAVRLDALPAVLGERRSRFLLDVARAHAGVGDTRAATESLLHAESISADEVRHHRITRQLVPDLIVHDRRNSGLRDLARRSRIPL